MMGQINPRLSGCEKGEEEMIQAEVRRRDDRSSSRRVEQPGLSLSTVSTLVIVLSTKASSLSFLPRQAEGEQHRSQPLLLDWHRN